MLIWTDIETTGLDRDNCALLEVAAIATDDALNEVARFQRTVYYPHAFEILDLGGKRPPGIYVDQVVIEMHLKNGLWADCRHGQARDTVDRDFADFIQKNATEVKEFPEEKGLDRLQTVKPQLAGSTISFDRGFIEKHLPRANAALHYRNVDVSTLNELGKRFWPEVYAARPNNKDKAHRGMADIEESIRVCKHYLANLAAVRRDGDAVGVVVTGRLP